MSDIIAELRDKDDKSAYARVKEIAARSELSSEYYPYLETFAQLLNDEKSYIRTRAFTLCCSQARWDNEGRIKNIFPAMMSLFHDPKPTVVRQSLGAIKEVIVFRPELSQEIKNEIKNIDISKYKDTMRPLIQKDISDVLELIDE